MRSCGGGDKNGASRQQQLAYASRPQARRLSQSARLGGRVPVRGEKDGKKGCQSNQSVCEWWRIQKGVPFGHTSGSRRSSRGGRAGESQFGASRGQKEGRRRDAPFKQKQTPSNLSSDGRVAEEMACQSRASIDRSNSPQKQVAWLAAYDTPALGARRRNSKGERDRDTSRICNYSFLMDLFLFVRCLAARPPKRTERQVSQRQSQLPTSLVHVGTDS